MPKEPEISKEAQMIFGALPKSGARVGNIRFSRALGLAAEAYWSAVEELDAAGMVVRGTGRGGTLALHSRFIGKESDAEAAIAGAKDESDLYRPLKKWLDNYYGRDLRTGDFYHSAVTGPGKNSKKKRGKWVRPDVSAVLLTTAEFFIPKKTLEVITIEAKKYGDISLVGVFEAASHRKFGHYSYVAFEWLEKDALDNSSTEGVETILSEARRFGVGVLQMRPGGDIDEIVEPQRNSPEPRECSEFVKQQFPDKLDDIRNHIG